jgi:hypothetical protein
VRRACSKKLAAIPPRPTVPELIDAPELATVVLLEHALDVVTDALLAEHPTLIDDFAMAREDGLVLSYAHAIGRRAASLRNVLWRYRRAVRDATTPVAPDSSDDDDILF